MFCSIVGLGGGPLGSAEGVVLSEDGEEYSLSKSISTSLSSEDAELNITYFPLL